LAFAELDLLEPIRAGVAPRIAVIAVKSVERYALALDISTRQCFVREPPAADIQGLSDSASAVEVATVVTVMTRIRNALRSATVQRAGFVNQLRTVAHALEISTAKLLARPFDARSRQLRAAGPS
jgi:hypothetical protein